VGGLVRNFDLQRWYWLLCFQLRELSLNYFHPIML